MAYDDELKAIALAETEEERLRLSGELAATIEAPAPSADLEALEAERDSLRAEVEAGEKKYNELREKYVDAFFSTASQGQGREPEPKEPPADAGGKGGTTLASLFGKE